MSHALRLYRFSLSGHSHRVQLFLSILGLPFEMIEINLATGAHKQPDYLKINPFGQVPALDDNGFILTDSTAILVYLAKKYADERWLPRDPEGAAQVQHWLSIASGQIARGPATARLVNVFGAKLDHERAIQIANSTFKLIEDHLEGREFLVGKGPTIADIAGYTYIAHAPEGGVSLLPYPKIQGWLARIEQDTGLCTDGENSRWRCGLSSLLAPYAPLLGNRGLRQVPSTEEV